MEDQLWAIVYSRVSTDAQERDGTSLDTQERASREYVDESGWLLVESIRDTARIGHWELPTWVPNLPNGNI